MRKSIPLREKIIVFFLGALLLETPWFLGGINVTAQFINLTIAGAAFVALFIPLADAASPTPLQNLRRLLKHPVFWCMLTFLLYLVVQYLNPQLQFMQGELNGQKGWWLEKINHIPLLPSGIQTPYAPMNPLRFLVMWATPLIAMCTFAIGVKRSKSWRILSAISILNATAISIVGMSLQYAKIYKVLGFIGGTRWNFFSSFANNNHASVFLYLNLGLALGIFLGMRKYASETTDVSGKHWLMLFPIATITAGVFSAGGRFGSIIALGMLAIAIIYIICESSVAQQRHFIKTFVFAALLLASVGAGGFFILQWTRPNVVARAQSYDISKDFQTRIDILNAAADVAKDKIAFGWGGGSFRYVSQKYTKKYDFVYDAKHKETKASPQYYLAHAHCDWLEFLSDFGIFGCIPLAVIGLYWMRAILRHIRVLPLRAWGAFLAILCVGAHAVFDFPLSCPAIQLTLVFFACGAAFWGNYAARRRPSPTLGFSTKTRSL